MDDALADRLRSVGVDPSDVDDPGEAWRRLHERYGRRATLIDRYALDAAHRGVRPDELDLELRARLGQEVLHAQSPDLELRPEAARRSDPIEVAPYDPSWPDRFDAWRDRLARSLGPAAVRIAHIGSTAVPGLAAKPVVDIQVSVVDVEAEPAYVPAIEVVGLVLRARESGHRYFRPPADQPRVVHVHVRDAGSAWEREHLLFRDYLRAHPAAAEAYAKLKEDLARQYPVDRLAYTDAKTGFVLDTLDAASEWASAVGWRLPDE